MAGNSEDYDDTKAETLWQRIGVPPLMRTEQFWFATTLIAAALVGLILLIGIVSFINVAPDDRKDWLASAYQVFIIAGAVLTFCTVVWRGIVTTRQADQHLEQIKTMSAQVAATDDSNLADLLLRGSELIAAEEPSRISAAIASLQSVAMANSDKYSIPAMDVLAGFIERGSGPGHDAEEIRSAIDALHAAHDLTGIVSPKVLVLKQPIEQEDEGHEPQEWCLIRGFERVRYIGGMISTYELNCLSDESETKYSFVNVSFEFAGTISMRVLRDAVYCKFRSCKFEEINTLAIEHNTFVACNFSKCRIDAGADFSSLMKRANYYVEGAPPKLLGSNDRVKWDEFFEVLPRSETG